MDFVRLEELGIDREEVLGRFMGNEALFGRILKKFLEDTSYGSLKNSLEEGDDENAFRAAHTLKGVSGNLGIGNIYRLSGEITEMLRSAAGGGEIDRGLLAVKIKELDEEYKKAMEIIAEV